MADTSVKMVIAGDEKDGLRALAALERKYDKLEAKMKGVAQQSKRGAKETGGLADKLSLATKFAGGAATAALLLARNMGQARTEAEATFLALEKSERKLRIQAGLTALQSEEARGRTTELASKTGFSQAALNRISTEAASQGFVAPLAKGGVTEALVAILQATNQGEDANLEELVGAFGKFLTGRGKKLTGENALALGVKVRGLFKGTPLQIADLPDFAKVAGIATQVGIGDKDLLSSLAATRGVQSAPEAATGFAKLLTSLTTGDKQVQAKLQRFGVDPKSVDLVGESLPQVLGVLGAKLKQLPPEKRNEFLAGIVGNEKTNLTTLSTLIQAQQTGKLAEFDKLQGDTTGFLEGVRLSRKGVGPGLSKAQAELADLQQRRIAAGGVTDAEIKAQNKIRIERQRLLAQEQGGVAGFFTGVAAGTNDLLDKAASLGGTFPRLGRQLTAEDLAEVRTRREGRISELKQQVADADAVKGLDAIKGVLESIDKKMGNNRPRPNRNANGE